MLFIDEAQDIKAIQWDLINSSFSSSNISVRQSFGDANQAIYHEDNREVSNTSFPKPGHMTISDSHRFGSRIANLIDPLGVKGHGIIGKLDKYNHLNGKHSIFLYNNTDDVLLAYAKYLLSCFSDEELQGSLQCYAVGMVHKKEPIGKEDEKCPIGIRDYWSLYDPEVQKHAPRPRIFIEFFCRGKELPEQSGDHYQLIDWISAGFRNYLQTKSAIKISNTGSAFNALLRLIPDLQNAAFRSDMRNMISSPIDSEDSWNNVVTHAKHILDKYFGITSPDSDYFTWHAESMEQGEVMDAVSPKNIFSYQDPETKRHINIHLASIHSEKGRTHLSTLVLDTFWYKRNIKELLPWLSNTSRNKPDQRNLKRLKCHYVALSRASGLICIAAPKNSVSGNYKLLLSDAGWNVIEI